MVKKQKAIIYPFDREFCPILRHKDILNDYDIVSVVSPNGWGYSGDDASTIDGGDPIGIIVDYDFDNALNKCDTVILADTANQLDFESILYPKIMKAIRNKKSILSTIKLDESTIKNIEEMCRQNDVSLQYFNINEKIDKHNSLKYHMIEKIKTPVIFVLGMSERTNKFEVQISLRKNLLAMDYKISQIGTRNYCEMFGFHSFPQFMFRSNITEIDKIVLFNNYIKDIEEKEQPDVIVIGIPGSIMPFNEIFTNDFGILAYQVSQAVKPDAAVFCSLYEDFLSKYFEELYKKIKYRFGFEIDCFSISNTKVDWYMSRKSRSLVFVTLGNKVVNKAIKELDIPSMKFFNVLNSGENLDLTNYLVNKLICEEYEAM